MARMNIFEALRVSHETQRELYARLLASKAGSPEGQRNCCRNWTFASAIDQKRRREGHSRQA